MSKNDEIAKQMMVDGALGTGNYVKAIVYLVMLWIMQVVDFVMSLQL